MKISTSSYGNGRINSRARKEISGKTGGGRKMYQEDLETEGKDQVSSPTVKEKNFLAK